MLAYKKKRASQQIGQHLWRTWIGDVLGQVGNRSTWSKPTVTGRMRKFHTKSTRIVRLTTYISTGAA